MSQFEPTYSSSSTSSVVVEEVHDRFIPSEEDRTPQLELLFTNIENLIASYMIENPEQNENLTRCFVAGNVCKDNIFQLNQHMTIITSQRDLTLYNAFISYVAKTEKKKLLTSPAIKSFGSRYKKMKSLWEKSKSTKRK
jgi:hypothetical protein